MNALCTAVSAFIAFAGSAMGEGPAPASPATAEQVSAAPSTLRDVQQQQEVRPGSEREQQNLAVPHVYVPHGEADSSPPGMVYPNTFQSKGLRNLPSAGGSNSCQLGYRTDGIPPASRNAINFNVLDDIHIDPTATGAAQTQLQTVVFSGQFRAGGGTFSSPYRDATPTELAATGSGGAEIFTIALYNYDADTVNYPGLPTSTPFFTQNVTCTRTDDATDTLTYNGGAGNVTFKIRNYIANVVGGPTLTPDQCYWLEIRRALNATSPIPAALVWRRTYGAVGSGNGYCLQKSTATTGTHPWSVFQIVFGFDFAQCVNLKLSSANSCPQIPTPPICPDASTNPAVANTHCQASVLNNKDQLIVVASTGVTATNQVISADNFTAPAGTKITGFCFDGAWNGNEPPKNEAYILRIWKTITLDGTHPYSFPDTSNLVKKMFLAPQYPSHVNPDGFVAEPGSVIYIARQAQQFSIVGTFQWVVDLTGIAGGGITLTDGGCYWFSIQGANTTTTVTPPIATDTFRYLLKQYTGVNGGINGDNYFVAKGAWTGEPAVGPAPAFSVTDQSYGYDVSFCLNFVLNTNNSICPPVPVAANSTCAGAFDFDALPITTQNPTADPTIPHVYQNLNAGRSLDTGLTPGDFWEPGDENSNGTWFKVVGTGNNIKISTCNVGSPVDGTPNQTNFDTTIYVYCSLGGCAGPFKFYDENNDGTTSDCTALQDAAGNPIGPSTVDFPTVSGVTYYVFVMGANTQALGAAGGAGFFWITKTAGTNNAQFPAVACSAIVEPPCVLTIPSPLGATEQLESAGCPEAAGHANSDPCDTDTTVTIIDALPLGNTVYGNQNNDGFTSFLDYYQLPHQTTANVGYNVECYSESPCVVGMVQLPCPFPAAADQPDGSVQAFFVPVCYKGIAFEAFYPLADTDAFATGNPGLYIFVRPTAAAGLINPDASTCVARSKYRLRVTVAGVGACCIPVSPVCVISNRERCTYQQSPDGSTVGVYIGDGSTCTPDTVCNHTINTGYSLAPFGACCDPEGNCYVTVAAACTGTGYHWTVTSPIPSGGAVGTCKVHDDMSLAGGKDCVGSYDLEACCFQDGTCQFFEVSKCTSIASTTHHLGSCVPNTCLFVPLVTCCSSAGICSSNLTATQCTSGGGTVNAAGACTPDPCPKACCNPTCSLLTPAACTAAGGSPLAQPTCTPNPCTVTCCTGGVCTTNLSATACTAGGGTVQAGNPACVAGVGNICPGLCCSGAACIANTLNANCTGANKKWVASGSCNLVGPPTDGGPINFKTPCCKGDFNHDGAFTTGDLFSFLTAWFGKTSQADINGNPAAGAGAITTADLFGFLTAWFGKGCS